MCKSQWPEGHDFQSGKTFTAVCRYSNIQNWNSRISHSSGTIYQKPDHSVDWASMSLEGNEDVYIVTDMV